MWVGSEEVRKLALASLAVRELEGEPLEWSAIGHEALPTLRGSRPAGAPALQWISALCGAGAPAGEKTKATYFRESGFITRGSAVSCQSQRRIPRRTLEHVRWSWELRPQSSHSQPAAAGSTDLLTSERSEPSPSNSLTF